MHIPDRFMMPQEENSPFVEKLLLLVSDIAYEWLHMQALKRNHNRKNGDSMDEELLRWSYDEIKRHPYDKRRKWKVQLLTKLRKDIQEKDREAFIEALIGKTGKFASECVLSNPDQKGKMRRIDPMKQADKVWRLDILVMIMFYEAPLESTDGERLTKIDSCSHKKLCINPTHIKINAKQIDVFIAKLLDPTIDQFSRNPTFSQSLPNPVQYNPYGGSKLRHQVSHNTRLENEYESPHDPSLPDDLRTLSIKVEDGFSHSPPLVYKDLSSSPPQIFQTHYKDGISGYGKMKSRFDKANGYSRSCPDFSKYPPRTQQNCGIQYNSNENLTNSFPATFGMAPERSRSFTPGIYFPQVGYYNNNNSDNNKFDEQYNSSNLYSSSQSIEYDQPSNTNTSLQSSCSQGFDQSSNVSFEHQSISCGETNDSYSTFNGGLFQNNNAPLTYQNQQQNIFDNISSIASPQYYGNNAIVSKSSPCFTDNFRSLIKYETIPENNMSSPVKNTTIDASVQNLFMIANQASCN